MNPWRTVTDDDILRATAQTHHRYRRALGNRVARALAKRKADRLRAGRAGAPTGWSIDKAVTLRAVELIGEDMAPAAAFARAAREVARETGR